MRNELDILKTMNVDTKMRKAEHHHKAVTERPSYLGFKMRVGSQVVGAAGWLTCYSHCATQYNLLEGLKQSGSGIDGMGGIVISTNNDRNRHKMVVRLGSGVNLLNCTGCKGREVV